MDGPSDSDLEGISLVGKGVSYETAQADAAAMERRLKELSAAGLGGGEQRGSTTSGRTVAQPLSVRATPLSVQAAPPSPGPSGGRGSGRGRGERGRPSRRRNRSSKDPIILPLPAEIGKEDLEDLTVQSQAMSDALADQREEINELREEIATLKESQHSLLSMLTMMQHRIDKVSPDTTAGAPREPIRPTVVVAPKKIHSSKMTALGPATAASSSRDDLFDNLDF